MPKSPLGLNGFDLAVVPYLDFGPTTNRVLLHAHQLYFEKVGANVHGLYVVHIYFNARLYDPFVGLPYELVSTE
ncbi:MAG: hypothetical protein ACKPKO_39055 [Candidatus Fonsibacter sp.]